MAAKKEIVNVMGRRWDTSRPNFFSAPVGLSLQDIVEQSLGSAYRDKVYTKEQYAVLCKYARCRLNGVEIDRRFWKIKFPEKGDRIEILHGVRGGGGGGGGKNPIATVLSVLIVAGATVATWWAGGLGGTMAIAGMQVATSTFATTMIGLVAAGALMAVNMLFPARPPSLGSLGPNGNSAEKTSQTYSLNGGKNAHNIGGYVPLILGRHRVTPPLGAKSWTSWKGSKQYFHMLVVWGHPDITVSDFQIGDTNLDKFSNVTHKFHQSTKGSGLKFFGKQYNEESVGATLKKSVGWVRRTVGECNDISIDICFPSGLTEINKTNGNRGSREVELEVQYKPTASGSWKGMPCSSTRKFGGKTLTYSYQDINDSVSVFYKNGKVQAVPRGKSVSGGIQIYPQSGLQYCYGCWVSCQPDGTKMKITVQPGVFKKNNKVYRVGGARLVTYRSYDDEGYGWSTETMAQGGKAKTLTIDSPLVIGVSKAGNIHKGSGFRNLFPFKSSGVSGGGVSWEEEKRFSYGGEYDDYHYGWNYFGWKAKVSGGSLTYTEKGVWRIIGAQQKQIVKNATVEGLSLKSYDVRIRRKTKDTTDSYIMDECQWMTMRAIISKPVFDTPVPICVSELRIQASEQLSGYVTEFNAICHSHIPDWTPAKKVKKKGKVVTVKGNWNTKRDTSNPASIMRYLLTSRHSIAKPFAAKRLDNTALVGLWSWCKKNGFRFDFVADSEEGLWSRLVSVLAPALAAPTTDVDGLWGAIWDAPNKTVRQLFTPRNSWGMQVQRGFARLPDALRVSFIDEDDNWTKKEGFVYNDGYNKGGTKGKKKANDVIEWDFPGVTDWKRIHKLARFHLAQLLHRQTSVTINTDWEWLAVHRGDLVGLSSDVLMNTFGTARITALIYRTYDSLIDDYNTLINEEIDQLVDINALDNAYGPHQSPPAGSKLVGIQIDDTVVFSSPKPARYGVAVRRPMSSGNAACKVEILEISPKYGEQDSVLYFRSQSKAEKVKPRCGDLVSISLLGEEYEEYLVASISPGENMSAQLTLTPYKTKEIMKAANARIPAYNEPVILDVVQSGDKLPTPKITSIRSDESAAVMLASGAVSVCIAVWWSVQASADGLSEYTVELSCADTTTGDVRKASRKSSSASEGGKDAISVENAAVGHTYDCKIRLTDPVSGRTSDWSSIVSHKVTGLVAPPPAPAKAYAVLQPPQGIRVWWDAVEIIDLHHYKITGSTSGSTKGKETEYVYAPTGQTGSLSYNIYSVDTTSHVSKTPATASVTVLPPYPPAVSRARLEEDGIVCIYTQNPGSWAVAVNEFECSRGGSSQSESLRCVLPVPQELAAGDTVRGRSKDAFENWGAWSDFVPVEIILPSTPQVEISVNENGRAAVSWQNCTQYTSIKHYVVSGCANGTTTGLSMTLDLDNVKWTDLDGLDNQDPNSDYRIGTIDVKVYAVDKWGFKGASGSASVEVLPPLSPVVNVEKRTDGLYLTWQDCKTTFVIKRYIVRDIDLDLVYYIDGTSQALKPREAGTYSFSVQAEDILGTASAEIKITDYYIGGVGAVEPPELTASIDGADILLKWTVPSSSWPIDDYAIMAQNGTVIGRAKTTYYRFPAPIAGSYEYGVVGRDIAGNEGPTVSRAAVTVNPPVAPTVQAVRDGDGVKLTWQAGIGENTLPVAAWDVVRQWDEDGVTKEADYGRLDVDSLTIPAMKAGVHTILVRAVDTAGNVNRTASGWGSTDFTVYPPGKVRFDSCATVDNNVMLYWSEPDYVFFPIEYYLFEEIDANGDGMAIGRVDALFTSTFETESGRYTYGITPVDTAGNMGTRTTVVMQVSQPPDFMQFHNYDSLFNGGNCGDSAAQTGRYQPNGGRTNFILDGEGGMVGPYPDATWNENLASIAELEGLASGANLTWAEKAAYGYEHWLSPLAPTAQYVELVDVTSDPSALIPSTQITVTVNSTVLAGNPVLSCKIEVSADGETWRTVSDDAFVVHATSFRYARYTIGVTGGEVLISGINYDCHVKLVKDAGNVVALASDEVDGDGIVHKANGDNWTSMAATPMLTGVWVPFSFPFTDVQSLGKPNVTAVYVNDEEVVDLTVLTKYQAYTVFEDVLNPQGFRVFVLDENGNRVKARVDWSAMGV